MSDDRLAAIRAYLDAWEKSFGMGTLPAHWGITTRIAELRELAEETE